MYRHTLLKADIWYTAKSTTTTHTLSSSVGHVTFPSFLRSSFCHPVINASVRGNIWLPPLMNYCPDTFDWLRELAMMNGGEERQNRIERLKDMSS